MTPRAVSPLIELGLRRKMIVACHNLSLLFISSLQYQVLTLYSYLVGSPIPIVLGKEKLDQTVKRPSGI